MDKIKFDGPPPPIKQKRIDIVNVKDQTVRTYTIISERPYSIIYHWVNGRSQSCRRGFGTCECQERQLQDKWAAYLHAICWITNEEVFIELSEKAVWMLMTLCNNRESLRGSVIKLSRTKGGVRGRYIVDMLERIVPSEDLPDVKFPDELLKRLWAAKRPVQTH
jgi:hypothetical protein